MTTTPTQRVATRVVSGDALRALERPASTTRAFIEAACLDAVHATRDTASLEWHAWLRKQPNGPVGRLTWHPGMPLPAFTLYATCTVTVDR